MTSTAPSRTPESARASGNGTNAAPSGRGASMIAGLALLTSLGCVASGYLLWQQQLRDSARLNDSLLEHHQSLSQQTDALQTQTMALQQQLAAGAEQALNERQLLNQQVMGLTDTLQLLRSKTQWGQRDWSLAEIHYLVQIAADRVAFMRDASTALAALQTAADRVDRMASPELAALRQQLQSDMTQLRRASETLNDNALSGFEQTLSAIRPLPVAEPVAADTDKVPPAEAAPASNNLLERLNHAISQRYRIVEQDQPLNPLQRATVPQHQYSLLQLRSESLRHALASNNKALFERELLSLQQWAASQLDGQLQQQLQQALAQLDTASLFPPLPALDSTLALIRGLLQHEHTSPPAAPEATSDTTPDNSAPQQPQHDQGAS